MCLFAEGEDPEIDVGHLERPIAKTVKDLINNYKPEKKKDRPIQMKILLNDEYPVYERPRRISPADKTIIDNQVEKWLEEKIVQPSSSEYASPVVLVPKKDGSKRLCCDYRRLNAKIAKDHFSMLLIDDVIERLQGNSLFTTFDLANGFFHVPVEQNSRKYTSFVTHAGQF